MHSTFNKLFDFLDEKDQDLDIIQQNNLANKEDEKPKVTNNNLNLSLCPEMTTEFKD